MVQYFIEGSADAFLIDSPSREIRSIDYGAELLSKKNAGKVLNSFYSLYCK